MKDMKNKMEMWDMTKIKHLMGKIKRIDWLAAATVILLLIITITGVMSTDFSHKWEFINQYGQTVEMYGYGIYANDTYSRHRLVLDQILRCSMWSCRCSYGVSDSIRSANLLSMR